jgi:hypothetical protein
MSLTRMTPQVIDGLHAGGDHPFTRAVAGVDHRKDSP